LLLLAGSGFTVFAGLRRLLFKQEAISSTQPEHCFKYRAPAAGPSALGLHQSDLTDEGLVDVVPSQHTVRAKDQAAKRPAVKHSLEGCHCSQSHGSMNINPQQQHAVVVGGRSA
jgi:hypothetical protein